MFLERLEVDGSDAGRVIVNEEHLVGYGLHWTEFVSVEWKFVKDVLVPHILRTLDALQLSPQQRKPVLNRLVLQLFTEFGKDQGAEVCDIQAWSDAGGLLFVMCVRVMCVRVFCH